MEVILTEDVKGIGKAGAVVKVKDGFARNFLFPKKLALVVTAGSMKGLQQAQERRNQKQEKQRHEAEALKAKLAEMSLTIAVLVQEKERLYGSITAQEIERALKDEGVAIEQSAIELEEPIKALGIYQVPVRLHPDVQAQVKVWIVKK